MSKPVDITVLYVEDEASIRESVANSLALGGNKVISASNGQEALELLRENPVDIIVTDIRMPKMDGLTMVEKIREQGFLIPIVITSAFKEVDYLIKAIELKVDKFINKPIRLTSLIDVIARYSEIITNKRELELRSREIERYREVIEITSFLIHVDKEGNIVDINKDLADYFHARSIESGQIRHLSLLLEHDFCVELLGTVLEHGIVTRLSRLILGNSEYTVDLTAFISKSGYGGIEEIAIMLKDLTPMVREKDTLIESLYTDLLTKLPNRQKLFNDLNRAGPNKTVFIIDIDHFSRLNNLYGFDRGDELLVLVAESLLSYWPDSGKRTLYRTDADHFVILSESEMEVDPIRVQEIAESIISFIEEKSYVIGNILKTDIAITIGSSSTGDEDLYTEALFALSHAKHNRIRFQSYDNLGEIKSEVRQNLMIQHSIKHALANRGILNFYQPIVDKERNVVKYEALVRMRDSETPEKIYLPSHFLTIAKDSKNYSLITQTVINTVFDDFAQREEGVGINLSFDDIVNPEIVSLLEKRLAVHTGGKITLELLESEGIKDIDKTIEFCYRMKAMGALIAIDDFGSGYSNFINLIDIPIDVLKIDGSIIKRLHEVKVLMMVMSIVSIAKKYNMKTIAEYVEEQTVFSKLSSLGVDYFQGYLFSVPKPIGEYD